MKTLNAKPQNQFSSPSILIKTNITLTILFDGHMLTKVKHDPITFIKSLGKSVGVQQFENGNISCSFCSLVHLFVWSFVFVMFVPLFIVFTFQKLVPVKGSKSIECNMWALV
jgi:hypothetical protein